LPRPPEVALAARVDCGPALGRNVDDDNLVGAVARPPEVKIGSGVALGEDTQPSKASTTSDAHSPLHYSVALALGDTGVQNMLEAGGDGKHEDNVAGVANDITVAAVIEDVVLKGARGAGGSVDVVLKGARDAGDRRGELGGGPALVEAAQPSKAGTTTASPLLHNSVVPAFGESGGQNVVEASGAGKQEAFVGTGEEVAPKSVQVLINELTVVVEKLVTMHQLGSEWEVVAKSANMMLAPLTTKRKLDFYDVRHVEMWQSDLARFRVTLAELEESRRD